MQICAKRLLGLGRIPAVWILTTIVICTAGGTAFAGSFRMTGFDTAAIAQGNSFVANGQGLGVLYSNPALLSSLPEHVSVQTIVIYSGMHINAMAKPSASDVPFSIYDSDAGGEAADVDRALPTAELNHAHGDTDISDWQAWLSLGFCHSLSIPDFRIGLLVLTPAEVLATIDTWYDDEREQYFSNSVHFARFGEWQKVLTTLVGASYAPADWVSLGLSLQVRLAANIDLDIYVPKATVQDYALFNSRLDARATLRPIAGLRFRPWQYLDIGLTFRWRSFIDVDDTGSLDLWNYHVPPSEGGDTRTELNHIIQKYKVAIDYEPMELALGLGAHYEDFAAQVVVTWNRWSDFRDMHGQRPEQAAEYALLDSTDPEPDGDPYHWTDTASVSLGMQYQYLDWATAMAGFAFHPTPAPGQTGRTNYADAHTLMGSLGHRFDFGTAAYRFRAELGFQLWRMLERSTNKNPNRVRDEFPDNSLSLLSEESMSEAQGLQTNNPGFPGFTQQGWVVVMSASFGFMF